MLLACVTNAVKMQKILLILFLVVVGVSVWDPWALAQELITLERAVELALSQGAAGLEAQRALEQAELEQRLAAAATEWQVSLTPQLRVGSEAKVNDYVDPWGLKEAVAGETLGAGSLTLRATKPLSTGGTVELTSSVATVSAWEQDEAAETSDPRLSLQVRQPLLRSPKYEAPWQQVYLAEQNVKRSELAARSTLDLAIQETVSRYLKVLLAWHNYRSAEQAQTEIVHQAEIVEDKVSRGMGTILDIQSARIEQEAARQAVEQARNELDISRRDLALYLGLESDEISLAEPELHLPDLTLEEAQETAVAANIGLQLAAFAVQEAEYNLARAKQDGPHLTVQGEVNDNGDWYAGVDISWSLLDGGSRQVKIEQAMAALEAAVRAREHAEAKLILDVRRAYHDWRASIEAVRLAKLRVEKAKTYLEVMKKRCDIGMATEIEVMQAIGELRDKRFELTVALYQEVEAHVRLLVLTGYGNSIFSC